VHQNVTKIGIFFAVLYHAMIKHPKQKTEEKKINLPGAGGGGLNYGNRKLRPAFAQGGGQEDVPLSAPQFGRHKREPLLKNRSTYKDLKLISDTYRPFGLLFPG